MVVPPPETEADVPPPLDEHHPLAVEDLKDNHPSLLREVSEKKVSEALRDLGNGRPSPDPIKHARVCWLQWQELKLDQMVFTQNSCPSSSYQIAPPPRTLPKHCRQAVENAEQCRHGKPPSQCHECARCPHGRQRQECKECNSNSRRWCPHNKRKHDCRECSGCPHNRVRRECKDCSGSAVCVHGRLRKNCRECKRTSAVEKCEHLRPRKR